MASQPTTNRQPTARTPGPKTLVGVVGLVCASLLYQFIPKEESGREVKVHVQADNTIKIENVTGRQFLRVYLDVIGVPTACDGLTGPEITAARKAGRVFTEDECSDLLGQELVKKSEEVKKCAPQLWEPETDYVRASAISLAYNIGSSRACKSTAFNLYRQRRYAEGCNASTAYNKAGGLVRHGLVSRRERERQVCLTNLVPGWTPNNLQSRVKAVR